jgi:hypothetical protein
MNTTMNTVNQTFNWSRFTAALRKEVVENKRMLLFTVICIYGLLTLIMIIGNLAAGMSADAIAEIYTDKVPQMFVGSIMSFVVCVSASMAFRNLTTKPGRAAYLTSPSSTLEKYLLNILIYIVGVVVAYFICAQLADLTRIAALWFFRGDNFIVPGPINFLTSITDMAASVEHPEIGLKGLGFAMILGLIANAGLYLLGSVIWPRLSLLKTFAAIYAIEFGLFLIVAPFFAMFGNMEALGRWFYNFITNGNFTISVFVIDSVMIVLYFGLAWYLFKRKDVISLKWWK